MPDVFHSRTRRWSQGNKGQKRALQRIDMEEFPKRGTVHRRNRYPNSNEAPIKRFLQAKIGEKWDDVYKEFAEVCDVRSNPQREVLERVGPDGWLVEHNIQMIDGVPHDAKGTPIRAGYRGAFYVHPETKTLEVYFDTRKPNPRWKPKPFVKIDELHQYHHVDGIWYEVEFKPYVEGAYVADILLPSVGKVRNNCVYTPYYWNYFNTNSSCTRQTLIDRYGAAIYPTSKLQCGKKALKKIQVELEKKKKAVRREQT